VDQRYQAQRGGKVSETSLLAHPTLWSLMRMEEITTGQLEQLSMQQSQAGITDVM